MQDLPWLVVHGRAVWVAALCGLPLVAGALGALFSVGRARARAVLVRRAIGDPVARGFREEGARVTIEGTVVGDARPAATTVSGPSTAGVRSSFAPTAVRIDVGAETIEIQGPAVVCGGSRELGPTDFLRLPAATQLALASGVIGAESRARYDAVIVARSIDGGDRVRARGVLRRVAASDLVHGYRRPAESWALVMHEREGDGLAFTGVPVLRGGALRAAGRGLRLGLVAFLLVSGGGGSALVAPPGPCTYRSDTSTLPLVIAAATPFRSVALRRLGEQLAAQSHHDPRVLEEEVALADLRRDPRAKQLALAHHRQLRRAADVADIVKNGSSYDVLVGAAQSLAELGEWDQASDRLVQARGDDGDVADAVVHLLAGHPRRAARTLRHAANLPEFPVSKGKARVTRAVLVAVADALDARFDGDRDALDRLRLAADGDASDRALHLLLADVLTGDARSWELHLHARRARRGPPEEAAPAIERLLAEELNESALGAIPKFPDPLPLGAVEEGLWESVPSLFEPRSRLMADELERSGAAQLASAIGDHVLATELDPVRPGDRELDLESVAGSWSGHAYWRRKSVAERAAAHFPEGLEPVAWSAPSLVGWMTTPRRDRDLASVLDAHPADGDHAYLVAGFLEGGAAQVSEWLRYGTFEHRARTRLGRLAELENLRLLAAVIHDDEEVAELGAMVERHRQALIRRDILVPLAILEDLVLNERARPDVLL